MLERCCAAVGGTCCVLYAVCVTMPRGHYAEAARRYTTMGPAAGEKGLAEGWRTGDRSDGERERLI